MTKMDTGIINKPNMCSYFMETIKQFENLTQLNKFEKENKGKLKISDGMD